MAALSNRMTSTSFIAVAVASRRGCPVKQPSPKKSPFPCKATTDFVFFVGVHGSAPVSVSSCEKGFKIKCPFALFHRTRPQKFEPLRAPNKQAPIHCDLPIFLARHLANFRRESGPGRC